MPDVTPDLKPDWHARAWFKQADGPEVNESMSRPLGMSISAKPWHASQRPLFLGGKRNMMW